MRRFLFTIISILVIIACGKKDDSSGTIAAAPPPAACMNGQAYCNSNGYGQVGGYAAYPVNPYYYGTNGNFCDCPGGYRPVYNGQYGMGCMNQTNFQPYANGAVYWGWAPNNNQWVNVNVISNTQGYPTSGGGCYRNVAQTCFIDQINSCGAGATCQPTAGGSRLGICTAGGANPGSTSSGYGTR